MKAFSTRFNKSLSFTGQAGWGCSGARTCVWNREKRESNTTDCFRWYSRPTVAPPKLATETTWSPDTTTRKPFYLSRTPVRVASFKQLALFHLSTSEFQTQRGVGFGRFRFPGFSWLFLYAFFLLIKFRKWEKWEIFRCHSCRSWSDGVRKISFLWFILRFFFFFLNFFILVSRFWASCSCLFFCFTVWLGAWRRKEKKIKY